MLLTLAFSCLFLMIHASVNIFAKLQGLLYIPYTSLIEGLHFKLGFLSFYLFFSTEDMPQRIQTE